MSKQTTREKLIDWVAHYIGAADAGADEILSIMAPELREVVFTEGSDGEWTCSGCEEDWSCEAETPETNGYHYCPGCGGRIKKYLRYGEGRGK